MYEKTANFKEMLSSIVQKKSTIENDYCVAIANKTLDLQSLESGHYL